METKNIPNHIALIPDGNRRWARKRGFSPWVGHSAGTKALEKILEKAVEFKIPYFTVWGGSTDNLTKRPKREIDFLFRIYKEQFSRLGKDKRVYQNKVKINVLGKWKNILPKDVQRTFEKVIEKTKHHMKYSLTFLIAYDGQEEMVDCVKRIADLVRKDFTETNNFCDKEFTSKLIKENLLTKNLPVVDLVIRTGCQNDPHQSAGFMMWDTAYSQYYFTDNLFPDFKPSEIEEIIKDFSKRERRLGK